MEKALEYIESHRDDFLNTLKTLIKIPSISTQSDKQGDVEKCAEVLAQYMKDVGLEARVMKTNGHPVVYGEKITGNDRPTILVYGHYDVQPSEPDHLWTTPPFEPTERDGKLYARGATDDKGQMFIHVAAVEALVKSEEDIPVNIKFLIEGEEEIGSPNLIPFFEANRDLLQCDALVISDTPWLDPKHPTITTGLRGLVYFQIDLRTCHQDLHSGSYGGTVENPAIALAKIIAGLKDDRGKILVPGIYDDVQEPSEGEREEYRNLPFDDEEYRKSLDARALHGEEGYTTLERKWVRPTLDVNGIWSGYTGEGAKTVLPAEAHAKVSMRLVPNQNPKKIADLLEKHIRDLCPETVEISIRRLEDNLLPYHADPTHGIFDAAKKALSEAFSTDQVVMIRQGGSIPFVPVASKTLGVPCLLLGFGLPGENTHSPNEWLSLDNFYGGIQALVRFYSRLGEVEFSS